jgi:replication factor A1
LETGAITAQPQNVSGHNFYGNNNTPQKPAQESYSNKPAPQDSTHGNIYPIPSLSPYAHKWTIRARVSRKSPIKSWHNQKGEGRLFSVTFVDEDGEIRATIFSSVGDNFDRWFELLQEGTVYFVSTPCSVKFANKKFNQSNNDYELTFEKDTGIEKAHDQTNVPSVKYNFTSIEDLQRVDKDTVIDCIGVVTNIGEVGSIVGKSSGKPFDKREITIADETRHEVRLTLWGDTATTFDVPLESIIACKGLKVSDFGGRSLSLLSSGSMQTNPDIEESHRLRGWYDAQGRTEEFANHNALQAGPTSGARNDLYKTIAQIKEENLGQTENAEYFTLKATVLYMKHEENKQLYYPSCKSEKCNKKVNEDEPGQWHCVACEKNWDSPQHRYILHLSLGDHTGQLWMDAFDDGGQLIMGVTADELHNERENDTPKAKEIIDNALCTTWVLRCRAKLDTYGDQQRYVLLQD